MTRLFYETEKLRIRICGGIHCSGNGGGRILEEAFLKELETAGVSDQVDIYRSNCLGECQNGPCVRIGTDRFYDIHIEDVPLMVQEEIIPRL